LYLDGTAWKPIAGASGYPIAPDRFVEVTCDPVRTKGLRIEVQLEKRFSGGIHE